MVKMKESLTLLLMIMHFQAILSSDEVSPNSVLERLDSIEAAQELHKLKIEQVETLFTGLKGKVERLEIKDKEIFGDLGKLDKKIADVGWSVSLLSLSKTMVEQRLQSNNGMQFELSGDEITKYAVRDTAAGPSSCQDLRMIGHNLDGFYTIRFNATIMKTIYCDFYGKIGNKMNPTTSMPSTPTSTLKAGRDFKVTRSLPLDHSERKSYPLMNGHGKCLAVETTGKIHPFENGAKIVQSTCNPYEKGQLWKYEDNSKSLCNDWNKCLSTPFDPKGGKTENAFHSKLISGETQQKWSLGTGNYKGMFIQVGWCLAIQQNSDANETRAITNYCKPDEKGQIWSFVQN